MRAMCATSIVAPVSATAKVIVNAIRPNKNRKAPKYDITLLAFLIALRVLLSAGVRIMILALWYKTKDE
jgi:hypothetical protein